MGGPERQLTSPPRIITEPSSSVSSEGYHLLRGIPSTSSLQLPVARGHQHFSLPPHSPNRPNPYSQVSSSQGVITLVALPPE